MDLIKLKNLSFLLKKILKILKMILQMNGIGNINQVMLMMN